MPVIPISKTLLLLIDFEVGICDPSFHGSPLGNYPAVLTNAAAVLAAFRKAAVPIVHVQHISTNPKSFLHPTSTYSTTIDGVELAGTDFFPQVAPLPDEPVMQKSTNSAFIRTGLQELIAQRGITRLVVMGITTAHCVSTSVRMAADLGIVGRPGGLVPGEILLVGDATANPGSGGFDGETMRLAHLAALDNEFCHVVTTENVLMALKTWT